MTDGKEEKAPRFAGIGGHHSHSAGTVEWLTPPWLLARLGKFDLDPCAPVRPWQTAVRQFTVVENGLLQRWEGRVWMNPPYANGEIDKWMGRMAEHGRGIALIFARTETDAFWRHVWLRASALRFIRGRINFHYGQDCFDEGKERKFGEEADGNAGAPTVLCAYGEEDAEALARCPVEGAFIRCRPNVSAQPQFEMEWSA